MGQSALECRVEAAATVNGFGTRRLHSLPAQFVSTQRAAQPLVGRPVLLVECSCKREEGGGVTGCVLHYTTLSTALASVKLRGCTTDAANYDKYIFLFVFYAKRESDVLRIN